MRASQKPRPFQGRYGALAGRHCWRPRRRQRVSPALPDEETMLKTGMKDLQPLSASHLHLKTPPLLTGRRQAQALRGRRGGLRALRRQRTKPAGQRDPFEKCARSWPCPPSLLHCANCNVTTRRSNSSGQSLKVSAFVDPCMPAPHAHIVMIRIMS